MNLKILKKRLREYLNRGLLSPALGGKPLPRRKPVMKLAQLLSELAGDRGDR
jgi:hypothetical protein